MTEPVYDRRVNLYCGPDHKTIPLLEILVGQLDFIRQACVDVNGINYGSRIHHINIAVMNAIVEVNKLIAKDVDRVITEKAAAQANAENK